MWFERMKALCKVLGAVLAFSIALTLLALLLDAMGGSATLMQSLMKQHAPASATGLAEDDYPAAATMIAGYLSGEVEDFQLSATVYGNATDTAFNTREQTHMADVRQLFVLARSIALGGTLICAVLLAACWLLRRPDGAALRGFHGGLHILLTLLAALLIWGLVDFDSLFVLFHHVAFSNDLWLLNPMTDLLIRLMPTEFFVHYAALVGGTWLGGLCLLEAVVPQGKEKKRRG